MRARFGAVMVLLRGGSSPRFGQPAARLTLPESRIDLDLDLGLDLESLPN
jgi:hypothetical protein